MSAAFIGGRVFSPKTLLTRAGFGYCVNQKCQIMTWAKCIWQKVSSYGDLLVRLTCAFYLWALCVIHMCEFYMWKGRYSFNANLASFEKLWCGKINQIKPKVIICVKQSNVFFEKTISVSKEIIIFEKKQFFLNKTVHFWCSFEREVQVAPQSGAGCTKTAPPQNCTMIASCFQHFQVVFQ